MLELVIRKVVICKIDMPEANKIKAIRRFESLCWFLKQRLKQGIQEYMHQIK